MRRCDLMIILTQKQNKNNFGNTPVRILKKKRLKCGDVI